MLPEREICQAVFLPAEATPASQITFERDLDRLLNVPSHIVDVDCSGLTRITSGHIGILWWAQIRCAENAAGVRLLAPSPGLLRILEAMDLRDLFRVGDVAPNPAGEDTIWQRLDTLPEYNDDYPVSVIDIDNAIDRLVAHLVRAGVPDLIVFDLRTICYEVSTNIRLYAQLEDSQTVSLNAAIDDDKITLRFTDSGPAFDLTAHGKTIDHRIMPLNRRYHGFGTAMILRLSDRVHYARADESQNILTIEKYWRKRP
jgi:anti-sigma regulatory factor (Ser/Thr protein kinase)